MNKKNYLNLWLSFQKVLLLFGFCRNLWSKSIQTSHIKLWAWWRWSCFYFNVCSSSCCCFTKLTNSGALSTRDGAGLSADGPVWAADLWAAPPASVLRQPERKKREHISTAGPLRQQKDTFTSQTRSPRGEQPSVPMIKMTYHIWDNWCQTGCVLTWIQNCQWLYRLILLKRALKSYKSKTTSYMLLIDDYLYHLYYLLYIRI